MVGFSKKNSGGSSQKKDKDGVELVEAESVDPNAPLEDKAEADDAGVEKKRGLKGWFHRRKMAIYHFFIPQPVMVPVQLVTPEVDLDNEIVRTPLKGLFIYITIALFFVVAVVWASLAEIDEVVRADGEIVPSDNVQLVQSRLLGSVVGIEANLGDSVSQGDTLFRIEDEDVIADFDNNEIDRLTALAAITRLEAERDELNTVVFSDELNKKAPEIVAQETALFYGRIVAKDGERKVLEDEAKSLRSGIREKQAEVKLTGEQVDRIEEERAIIAPLVQKGVEPIIQLLSIESRLEDAKGRKVLANLSVERLQNDLDAQNSRLESLKQRYRADVETQLVEYRTRAAQASARLESLKGKVSYAEVKSPVDGIISAVHVKTIGAVVDAGALLAEVVPNEESVTIRARVLSDDVAKITVGQKVRISLAAFDVSRYGALDGIVEQIASNSTQEENAPPYFVTMIEVPDPVYENSGFRPEITSGMTAIVDVLGDKRTILDYILSPIQRAQTIVFREK